MSTEKLKKRKFKEKIQERTLEIIKEPKTLETKKKKKSGLDLKKRRKKEKLDKNEEEIPVKVADTVDTMTFEKTKTKTKKKSKLGLKNKDDGMMYLDGRIGHEGSDKKHRGVEKEKKRKSGLKKTHRAKGNEVDGSYGEQIEADEHVDSEMVHADGIDNEKLEQELKGIKMEKKIKLGLKTKRRREKAIEVDVSNECQIHVDDIEVHGIGHEEVDQKHQGVEQEKKRKSGLKKKRRREIGNDVDSNYGDHIHADEHVDSEVVRQGIDNENFERKLKGTKKEKKIKLGLKKKRRREKTNEIDVSNEGQIHADDIEADDRPKSDHAKRSAHSQTSSKSRGSEKHKEAIKGTNIKSKKLNEEMNYTQKDLDTAKKIKSKEMFGGVEEKVEEIQSVDEDCSRGMKKWLIQYKESRPGLKILQERIDDYITAYEEQQEQERKEKEAQAAEGGWTVVVHHKGRKKTTDAETGVSVGSVAQAAVADKMGRKKSKEAPIDFYRFQKREAHRNEVMLLRSKFEQDKKRIQQLRAARKFRPY